MLLSTKEKHLFQTFILRCKILPRVFSKAKFKLNEFSKSRWLSHIKNMKSRYRNCDFS